jgi:hypothetical protein
MRLFPFHDAAGKLYPELDTREVSVAVVCQYLGVSRWYVQEHAKRGDYGRTIAEGAWFMKARVGKGGEWRFRPAVLWRVKKWGRFAQVGFDAMALERAVRIYACDPTTTHQRHADQATNGQDMVPALTHALSGLMEAMSVIRLAMPRQTAEVIPFELELKNK